MKKREYAVIYFIVFFLILLVSCTTGEAPAAPAPETAAATDRWLNAELTDIRTGQAFTVSEFAGTKILLESFAVWCPVCARQQEELQKFHQEMGDGVVSISLATDPNEDEALVKEYLSRRNFSWRFAISPPELTTALIEQFGAAILNAPAAPMVLICENLSMRFLPWGLKSVEELKIEISQGCTPTANISTNVSIVEEAVRTEDKIKEAEAEERAIAPADKEEKPLPLLVQGKTAEERLQEAIDDLHTVNSALRVKANFPDLELVFTDYGDSTMPPEILPFSYYYSKEVDRTFNLCAVDLSVFICEGKLDRLIGPDDLNSGRCIITPIYQPTVSGKFRYAASPSRGIIGYIIKDWEEGELSPVVRWILRFLGIDQRN